MVMFYALVVLCFSSGALAQMAGWGPCPKVDAMEDFNIRSIQGRWFESRRYFSLGEMTLKCVTADLLHGGGHGIIQMNTTAISRITGKTVSMKGVKIRVADPAEPGKLEAQLPSSEVWRKYWILGTDAHDYMVGYSCVDLLLIHLKYVWISTRQQQPSKTVINKAVKVMEKQKLNTKWLIITDQENCDANLDSEESEENKDAEDSHILY